MAEKEQETDSAMKRISCSAGGEADGEPWRCDRPRKARGLCTGHLRQEALHKPLRPLRARPGGLVLFPIRVSRLVAECASADPVGVRTALERWAKGMRRPNG